MIQTTVAFLDHNNTEINTNAATMNTILLIKQHVAELQAHLAVQLKNSKGVATDKNQKRESLEKKALRLSAAICAFANITENLSLFKENHLTKSQLQNGNSFKLSGICSYLMLSLNQNLTSLQPFGVNEAAILDFSKALALFTESINRPSEERTNKRQSTLAIASLLTKITTLLTSRLDYNMMFFDHDFPSLVATYQISRRVGKSPTRQLGLVVQTISLSTQRPISNAKLQILNQKGIRLSSEKGRNTFLHLSVGQHQITVTHPDYQTKTVSFSIVNGETTKIVVELEEIKSNASPVPLD